MTAWPLLVLAVGCAMAALSSGRWQVSIAAWLAPALLLGFSRTQDLPVALAPPEGLRTVYARIGDAFAWLCAAATGCVIAWGTLIGAGII